MTKIIFIILTLILSGCGQGEISGAKNQEKSIGQFFSSMEANGSYPVLDRTDTLAGIDANHNGIRDDIDLYISKQGYDLIQLKAANQSAKAIQNDILININDPKAVLNAQNLENKASACIGNINYGLNNNIVGDQISVDIEALTTNTRRRLKAYLAFNETFNGTTFSPDDYKDPCEK